MSKPSGYYSIAGLVVRSRPADLPAVTARLSALAGVDIHHEESVTGRLVVTIETTDFDDELESVERIRRQTGVLSAELVYHYVAPPDEPGNPRAGVAPGAS